MRRIGKLAIVLASLMLITIKCTGGVNPGQARDTHQAIALAAVRAGTEPASSGRRTSALLLRAATRESRGPRAARAPGIRPRQECLGVILHPSMWTSGIPRHPGDRIHGKVIMEGGPCPPRDGYLILDLQMRGRFKWRTLASDEETVPHLSGQKKVLGVFPPCPSGTHHFRLRIHGRGHRADGEPTKADVKWPSLTGREIHCP